MHRSARFVRSMGAALNDEPVRRRVWAEHAEILDRIFDGEALPAQEAAATPNGQARRPRARDRLFRRLILSNGRADIGGQWNERQNVVSNAMKLAASR